MAIEQCYPLNLSSLAPFAFECFALDKTAPKYFGFAELINGLALTIVLWTIADLRYKFRIYTSGIPIERASVVITIIVGVLTLLSDYWRASGSRVPVGGWLTPELWQLILGGSFFLVLAIWLLVAIFLPPKFNARNARRFNETVERYLLGGDPKELAIVGKELDRSVSRIVGSALDDYSEGKITTKQNCAIRLLLVMGNPKFCRAVVDQHPQLIITLFNAVRAEKRYNSAIEVIAKNLVTAAIENKQSFLYYEKNLYYSGLEGITRPVTSALCQCSDLVIKIEALLNPDYSQRKPWDLEQWEGYFRLLLEAFTVYVRGGVTAKSSSLHWAYIRIEEIYSDLTQNFTLTELRGNDGLCQRIRLLGNLIKNMVSVVDKVDGQNKKYPEHVLGDIADILFLLIKAASSVRKPRQVSRKIQNTMIWEEILNAGELRNVVGGKILKEIHQKLFDSIRSCPNLDGVRLLGYCLSVMEFSPVAADSKYGSSWRDLHYALVGWVKKNLSTMLERYPSMAHECFVDGMSYDKNNSRLVISDGTENSSRYLEIDPPEPLSN